MMHRRPPKEEQACPALEVGYSKVHIQKSSSLLCLMVRLTAQAAIFVAATVVLTEYWRLPPDLSQEVRSIVHLESNGTKRAIETGEQGKVDKPIPVVELGFLAHNPAYGNPSEDVIVEPADEISNNPQYKKFFDKYCDPGDGSASAWPQGEDAWQRRAPNFLIIGAKKAGTTSYWGKLVQHPLIIPGKVKEMHHFQPEGFGQWKFPSEIGTKVNVPEARRTLYDTNTSLYQESLLKRYPQLLSFEATPDYLLLSDISSHIILCTAPWAKILVTLRDPIERLFSNYNFIRENMPTMNATFEQWVERDMDTLRRAGVIAGVNETKPKATGRGEQVWWKYYQKMSRFASPERQVGRSLYVLQLQAWLQWMREAGRDPQDNMRIVWQEDLRQSPNSTLNDIAQWLGLPAHAFNTDSKLDLMVTNYTTEMAPTTRSKLERFFAPYNDRLHNLLHRERITFPAR